MQQFTFGEDDQFREQGAESFRFGQMEVCLTAKWFANQAVTCPLSSASKSSQEV
jgi:hypothetical protein